MYTKIKRIQEKVKQVWPQRGFQVRVYRHCCAECGYFERNSRFTTPSGECPDCNTELAWAAGVLSVVRYLLGVGAVRSEVRFVPAAVQPDWRESPVWLE